jgi:hypothetical protein
MPTTRGFAQRLWNRVFLTGNSTIIRTSLFEPPPSIETDVQRGSEEVANIEEASARAGFVPRLPTPEAVDGWAPAFRILHFRGSELTIRTSDILARLQRAGVNPADVEVPAEWDGVVIRFPGGDAVFAQYGANTRWVSLGQAKLSEGILVPSGFAVDRWVEVMLRTVGLSAVQAREQRNRFAANPFGILLVPPDYKGTVREVPLPSGSAILIENDGDLRRCMNCPEIGEIAIQWNTSDRSYRMLAHGLSQNHVIDIANSVE